MNTTHMENLNRHLTEHAKLTNRPLLKYTNNYAGHKT